MPWNEEISAAVGRHDRLAASPRTYALLLPLLTEVDVRAVLPSIRVPTLVLQHADDLMIPPAWGKYVADHIPGAKYVELPGATRTTSWNRGGIRSTRSPSSSPATGVEVADDRVLATVLFTDIVDSTRRASEMGDRDWHALLDAHDAIVRVATNSLPWPRGEHVG